MSIAEKILDNAKDVTEEPTEGKKGSN